MANKNTGLGKGLSAIFSSSNDLKKDNTFSHETSADINEEISQSEVKHIDINSIIANEYQPRKIFEEEQLAELAESIKKYGILQPLLLTKSKEKGKYELIAGERRLRAAKIAGLDKVPVIIKEVSDLEKFELALIENIQRQDLTAIEKAQSYKQLMDVFDLNQEEAAKRLGISRVSLANSVRLLNLPIEMQKAIADGKISEGQSRSLLALSAFPEDQQKMFHKMLFDKFPVRKAEEMVKAIKGKTEKKYLPDFRIKDLEEKLASKLQTKVDIKWNGKKGKVIIEIFDLDDINNLL